MAIPENKKRRYSYPRAMEYKCLGAVNKPGDSYSATWCVILSWRALPLIVVAKSKQHKSHSIDTTEGLFSGLRATPARSFQHFIVSSLFERKREVVEQSTSRFCLLTRTDINMDGPPPLSSIFSTISNIATHPS